MPAFLQSFIEAEQERSRRIEQLRKEIREFAKEEAGSSITEQILLFLADEMVEHLSEIDYELRMKFELYITPLIKRNYIYRYTGTFDRIRQAYIRERMKTLAGQRECEWKYKNEILFVPYHSDPVIVKSVETVRCRSNMVWNFKAAASEKLKRQIFTVLEYILENYEISRLREYKLTGLQLFYEFCIREQITDIQLLELEQETAFQDYLKQKVEKEQRRKRLKSIVETARKVLRMIYEKDIRDDSGKLFGFGTHMFRHCYGVKLTELHVDDWTIAKLLGHKGVKSVQYYRKMSNQRLADETREVRNLMSQIILANLDGWGEEYEQIRQDAGIE